MNPRHAVMQDKYLNSPVNLVELGGKVYLSPAEILTMA